ncbi:hypothetical protein DFJ74DRAFT_650552 [Hyaloraphidium curvatum]|nr:hypothetical protein DFJ74DRAFT_650552 [Hyaloraphidium curvatum]
MDLPRGTTGAGSCAGTRRVYGGIRASSGDAFHDAAAGVGAGAGVPAGEKGGERDPDADEAEPASSSSGGSGGSAAVVRCSTAASRGAKSVGLARRAGCCWMADGGGDGVGRTARSPREGGDAVRGGDGCAAGDCVCSGGAGVRRAGAPPLAK